MKGAVRYVVTVTAVVERVERVGGDWTKVGEKAIDGSDKLGAVFGHTPVVERTVHREIEAFKQTVDELDLSALVSVVNGIKAAA